MIKKIIIILFTYILPVALGVILVYATIKNITISELANALKQGNYFYTIPVLIVSIGVYMLRVIRWKVFFNTINQPVNNKPLFASLCIGYAVNFALPRFGEIVRAVTLKKNNNIPINNSLSTIVFERMIDTFCLFIITVSVFAAEYFNNGALISKFINLNDFDVLNKILVLMALLSVGLLLIFFIKKIPSKITNWIQTFIKNFIQLFYVKKPYIFLLSTLGIWVGFYLMTYLWFFMFKETQNISFYDAYLVMFLGVVARTLPIQAGSAGAYHFVVSSALILLGVSQSVSVSLAFIIHGFQSLLTLLLGLCAYLWMLLIKNKT